MRGVVFLLVGALGFVTTGTSMAVDAGSLLGLFPVNLLHNLVHVLFGVWGLVAGRSGAQAVQYCTLGGAIYLVLAVLGVFIPTTFGLIPIGGHDVWLHALLGAVLLGVGVQSRKAVAA